MKRKELLGLIGAMSTLIECLLYIKKDILKYVISGSITLFLQGILTCKMKVFLFAYYSNRENDLAWVISLDNSNILCTPSARAVIPPPMCFTEVLLGGYPNEFSNSRSNKEIELFILIFFLDNIVTLQNEFLKLFEYDESTKQFKTFQVKVEGAKFSNTKRPRHLRFVRTHTLKAGGLDVYGILFFVFNEGNAVNIAEIAVAFKDQEFVIASEKYSQVNGQITGAQQSREYCSENIAEYILYQYKTGDIYQYDLGGSGSVNQQPLYKRPEMFVNFYEVEQEGKY